MDPNVVELTVALFLVVLVIALTFLVMLPGVFHLVALMRRPRVELPKPPTDEELFEFHRQVNVINGCSRARD